jgi:hypothetical protein
MMKQIEARAWNTQADPVRWRIVVGFDGDTPIWRILSPVRVVKSTLEHKGVYRDWTELTYSGKVAISDEDFSALLAEQNQHNYHGPYRVATDA